MTYKADDNLVVRDYMNKAEKLFRNRVIWAQFLLCILVIWVHSYNVDIFKPVKLGGVVRGLESFISDGLGQTAVPGFFMISAFLFYRQFDWDQLLRKWKSRFYTLVIPYMLWNLIYYIAYFFMTNIPAVHEQLHRSKVQLSLSELFFAIVYFRYNSVFWFMFQLILLVMLAPAVYGLLRRKRVGAGVLALVFLCLMFRVELPFLNLDALMYYLIGAYAALHGEKIVTAVWKKPMAAAFGAALLVSYCIHLVAEWTGYVQLLLLYRITFPICLWLFLGCFRLPAAWDWMKHTFFVYATHFLIIRAMNKLGGLAFPNSALWALVFYLLGPVPVFAVSLAAAVIGKRLPKFWRLLGGGRVQKNGA